MASFWSDTVVDFINGLTDTSPTGAITAIVTESAQERAIEQGRAFLNSTTLNIPIGESKAIQVITGATGLETMGSLILNASETSTTYKFYEGSIANGGTAGITSNMNRHSLLLPIHNFIVDPTVSDYGTLLYQGYVGITGENLGCNLSYQLGQNTSYIFEVTNDTLSAEVVNLQFVIYNLEEE